MVNSLEPSFFLHQLLRHLSILAGVLQREIANSMSHTLYTELSFRRDLFENLLVSNQRKWCDCYNKMVVGLGWFTNYFYGFVITDHRTSRTFQLGHHSVRVTGLRSYFKRVLWAHTPRVADFRCRIIDNELFIRNPRRYQKWLIFSSSEKYTHSSLLSL